MKRVLLSLLLILTLTLGLGAPRVAAADAANIVFRLEDGILSVSYDGGSTYRDLGTVVGKDGKDGEEGSDGRTPAFRIADGFLFVSYDEGINWTVLGNVRGSDGRDGVDGKNGADGEDGARGQSGKNGADGEDGTTPLLRLDSGVLSVSYDGGATFEPLGAVSEPWTAEILPSFPLILAALSMLASIALAVLLVMTRRRNGLM